MRKKLYLTFRMLGKLDTARPTLIKTLRGISKCTATLLNPTFGKVD